MPQRRTRHKRHEAAATGTDNNASRESDSQESTSREPVTRGGAPGAGRSSSRFSKNRGSRDWSELRESANAVDPAQMARPNINTLASLIEQDAPLQSHSGLVLMYGPFQSEMQPTAGVGIASWIRECLSKHGLPSLVRYDYRRRAQVYRRDQFQPWLEPLLEKVSG
jgi:hypothetical protein